MRLPHSYSLLHLSPNSLVSKKFNFCMRRVHTISSPWTVTMPLSFVFLCHHHHHMYFHIVCFSPNAYQTKPFWRPRWGRVGRQFLESELQKRIMVNHQIGLTGFPLALLLLIKFSDWFLVLQLVPLDNLFLLPPLFFTLLILESNW